MITGTSLLLVLSDARQQVGIAALWPSQLGYDLFGLPECLTQHHGKVRALPVVVALVAPLAQVIQSRREVDPSAPVEVFPQLPMVSIIA